MSIVFIESRNKNYVVFCLWNLLTSLFFSCNIISAEGVICAFMEQYSRGWRGAPAKGVGRATGARVQIPPAPPLKKWKHLFGAFFVLINVEYCRYFSYNDNGIIW